jgi:redox-sensitive bicupin YhaK (pirin superfamily)
MPDGGLEWMRAGAVWHGGGSDEARRTSGFQLWVAEPAELELGPCAYLSLAPGTR